MICDSCKTDRLITDFINNQKICYHCMYRIKLQKIGKERTPKPTLCRCCGEEVVQKKDLKKRQRTVFCSLACAEEGRKYQSNNHWTRLVHPGEACRCKGKNRWNFNQT